MLPAFDRSSLVDNRNVTDECRENSLLLFYYRKMYHVLLGLRCKVHGGCYRISMSWRRAQA